MGVTLIIFIVPSSIKWFEGEERGYSKIGIIKITNTTHTHTHTHTLHCVVGIRLCCYSSTDVVCKLIAS